MKLITVLNDIHEGSTMELEGAKYMYNPLDPDEYYIGDNIDMVNCKKKLVPHFQERLNSFRKAYGSRFITGNHEAQRDHDRVIIVPGTNVGLMHGDFIFWGEEKSVKYRRKDHGAGFLKRGLWVNALEALENGYERVPKKEDLALAAYICDVNQLDLLIVGHRHLIKEGNFALPGTDAKLKVLPRGRNEVWI